MLKRVVAFAGLLGTATFAASVQVPGNVLTIPGISTTGTSFTYSGTLTQADTIAFSLSGNACLQSGNTYCTNGAGVVTVAGSTAVGGTSTFTAALGGFTHTYNYGSIVMIISGVDAVQIFPANATNGLGSGTPPAGLSLPATSLGTLGFGTFSVSNPTITFIVADTGYTDNSGTVTLSQGGAPLTPAPGTLLLMLSALGLGGLWMLTQKHRDIHA